MKVTSRSFNDRQVSSTKAQSMGDNLLRFFKIANIGMYSLIVVTLGYVVIAPYLPNIDFWLNGGKDAPMYEGFVARAEGTDEDKLAERPDTDRLVIHSIGVDIDILQGGQEVLNNGVWKRPASSSPERGGNTVIAGHRYLYTDGPNTFYHLDKVAVGDYITIFWKQIEYVYEVEDIFIVDSDRIDIEENTNEDILTIYTCTPLWTAEKRLVVRAKKVYTESSPSRLQSS